MASRQKLVDMCDPWINFLSENTSLHGVSWYPKTENRFIKSLICLFTALVIFGLPWILIVQMIEFQRDVSILNSVDYVKNVNLSYPNLTICHPSYFDMDKLKEYNISSTLANYILMGMNPTSGVLLNYLKNTEYGPGMEDLLVFLKNELDLKMTQNGFKQLTELYQALAIGCEHLISFCDIHSNFLMSKSGDNFNESSCCEAMFNTTPFFTYMGTCYTTNQPLIERLPSIFSSVVMWLDGLDQSRLLTFNMFFHGSSAVQRGGFAYVLSKEDHPAAIMISNFKKIPIGTVTTVGLKKEEFDRSQINFEPCLTSKNDTFKSKYGCSATQANCKMLKGLGGLQNCSVSTYFGLPKLDPSLRDCLPSDFLFDGEMFGDMDNSVCPKDCIRTDYDEEIAISEVLKLPIDEYNAGLPNGTYKMDASRMSILQFYFRSLDSTRFVQYQEGWSDFLSKVGGWMGLAVGASIFSFVELAGFFLILFKTIIGNWYNIK